MKKIINCLPRLLAVTAMVVCVEVASAQTTKDTINPGKPDDPMIMNPEKTNDANAVMTDTGFISKNIMDNMMEIRLSKAGQEKGNAAVKKIAALMVTDHTAMLNDLRMLAASKHAGSVEGHMGGMASRPPMPETTNPEGDFNATWASQMLTMHDAKIRELESFVSVTQDAQIKALAMKALPKIKMHRDMLAQIPGAKTGATNVQVQ